MKTQINDIAYYLPPNCLTNDDLAAMNPGWDIKKIAIKTGIYLRRVAGPDQTTLDMAVSACNRLLDQNPGLYEKIDGLLFCGICSDLVSPKNSYLLHKALNLPRFVFCLDIGLACSGFVYSLAVANGLIATGVAKNILIITADAMSEYINDHDRSCKCLFSDGACATWVSKSRSSKGLIDTDFGALGKSVYSAYIPSGDMKNRGKNRNEPLVENPAQMVLDGKKLLAIVGSNVPRQVKMLLKRNALSIADIDLFVFHQGSKLIVDALQRVLRLPAEKMFRNYRHIGNTSSASVPIALKDAGDTHRLKDGNKVMISGFGSGVSWGTALLEI